VARPAWTSKDDPAYTIVGKQIVANQGNWRQGQTNDPLVNPRFVFAWRVDGGAWSAQAPPSRTRPSVNVPGVGIRTYDFSHLTPGPHTIQFQVFAGSFYLNPPHAGPDEEGEWIEWGGGRTTDDSPYVVDVPVTVADTTPPPPAPEPADDLYPWMPHLRRAQDDLEHAVAAYYMKRGQGADQLAVLRRQRFGMMHALGFATDAERRAAHAALAKVFGWPT
jgi:hypothetical protein